MNIAFINGNFVDSINATISIFDRGFLFGDSVYEVLPVYDGQPFFVDRHLSRLKSNLTKIKINWPEYNWQEIINRLVIDNGGGDLQVYIQVTRGNQGARKHDIPASLSPTVVAFTIHNAYPVAIEKQKGLSAKLIEDIRWLRCDIKTTSLLGNILLNDDAVSSGYQTSILVRDGFITEGSTSNVFIVNQDGVVKTPPLNHQLLPGITRHLVIELIKKTDWQLVEESFSVEELLTAQEVWITSTTKEIYPITAIDGQSLNEGIVGPYWQQIDKLYNNLISEHHE